LQKTYLDTLKLEANTVIRQQLAILRSRLEHLKDPQSGNQEVSLEFELKGKNLQFSINEARFAELAQPLLSRIRMAIARELRDAKIAPESLDEKILVDGASRLPKTSRLIIAIHLRSMIKQLATH